MYFRALITTAATLALLGGCAATIDPSGLEQRTAQAIGRTVGQFTISGRSEETGGRINYTVNTRDGAAYTCYMYSATGFQRAMSFGQTPHSDAICTPMVGGPKARPAGGIETCNALMRAAKRC